MENFKEALRTATSIVLRAEKRIEESKSKIEKLKSIGLDEEAKKLDYDIESDTNTINAFGAYKEALEFYLKNKTVAA